MTTYPERAPIEKFLILNFMEIVDLTGGKKERILSIFKDTRKEIDAGRIINNMVVASDNQDTQWLFDVKKIENNCYYLEFTGTAK